MNSRTHHVALCEWSRTSSPVFGWTKALSGPLLITNQGTKAPNCSGVNRFTCSKMSATRRMKRPERQCCVPRTCENSESVCHFHLLQPIQSGLASPSIAWMEVSGVVSAYLRLLQSNNVRPAFTHMPSGCGPIGLSQTLYMRSSGTTLVSDVAKVPLSIRGSIHSRLILSCSS